MTPERRIQIEEHDSPLTANELALGWHFCPEFDGMLTSGEPTNRDTPKDLLVCACGNKINPNTCITYEGEEPHGTRDTFVPPPVKSDIELLREKLISMDAITEIDIGGCPPLKYVKYTDEQLDQMQSVRDAMSDNPMVYDPNNDPVPHCTDEELTAALIKHQVEADAYDKNLAQEMKVALDSLTEEDMKPNTYKRPTPAWEKCPQPSEEKTIHYHDHKWWYWDETNMHRHGPYETHAECLAGLKHYCHVYLGHPEDPS